MRWKQHLNALRSNRHIIPLMQHDFNNYGETVFAFSVLEKVDFQTRYRERDYMRFFDSFNPNKGYNYLDTYIGDKRKHEEKIDSLTKTYGINRKLLEKPDCIGIDRFIQLYSSADKKIQDAVHTILHSVDNECSTKEVINEKHS